MYGPRVPSECSIVRSRRASEDATVCLAAQVEGPSERMSTTTNAPKNAICEMPGRQRRRLSQASPSPPSVNLEGRPPEKSCWLAGRLSSSALDFLSVGWKRTYYLGVANPARPANSPSACPCATLLHVAMRETNGEGAET